MIGPSPGGDAASPPGSTRPGALMVPADGRAATPVGSRPRLWTAGRSAGLGLASVVCLLTVWHLVTTSGLISFFVICGS